MNPYDALEASLLDLLYELKETSISLIVGGGYGIYLKQQHVRETGKQTLLREIPAARSTNDIDVFLRTELLADKDRSIELASALRRIDCKTVDTAKYYQFTRKTDIAGEQRVVKFDLLTGPLNPEVDKSKVLIRNRRVRPSGIKKIGIHGRMTEEALGIEQHLVPISISGVRSNGASYRAAKSRCLSLSPTLS